MAAKNQRWWLTEDSETVVIDAAGRAHLRPRRGHAPHGRVEPRVPTGRLAGRRRRARRDATFVGHNRGGPFGLMQWSRRGRVLIADRGEEFAFVTEEGGREGTVWRYRFEPVDGGTRVTESYDVEWIPTWARIVDVPTNRHRELVEGMRHTLEPAQDRGREPSITARSRVVITTYRAAARHRRAHVELPRSPASAASSDQRVRAARRRARAGRHRLGRRGRRVHDRAANGHRSDRPSLDLAHATPTSTTSGRCTRCSTRTRGCASSPRSSGWGSWGSRRHRCRWTGCTS